MESQSNTQNKTIYGWIANGTLLTMGYRNLGYHYCYMKQMDENEYTVTRIVLNKYAWVSNMSVKYRNQN